MIRKTIAMPDDMGTWVEHRIQSGQYNNDSEYFRDLVRRDQERQEAALQLRQMLEQGEASGISTQDIPDMMKDVEERLRKDGRLPTH
ncbi:MAG: type II toxin-antitoxin system ParD family antitoxin [Nitrospirota bacterium]|jgi:antitoxin ParD1/3/4|nr:type II toxin-antitoxin system ParD family antitoxin [Nitrospirota bacterium]MDX2419446.1 type II toxin-antitoxin system ParD family antitoxin [Nitrospirota bacterium]